MPTSAYRFLTILTPVTTLLNATMSKIFTTLTVLTLATVCAKGEAASSTPNIVLIVADDLGYGDLGCFGNTTLPTPHLDKLASEGVRLTQNIAAYSSCTPSRAAFLTGRYSIRSGMLPPGPPPVCLFTASACGLPASEVTIGEVAKEAGYRTAYIGKWHLGWSMDRSDPGHRHPLNQGFDYFYGTPLTNLVDFGEKTGKTYVMVNPNLTFQSITAFTLILVTTWCLVRQQYVSKWAGLLVVTILGAGIGHNYFSMTNMKLLNCFMFRNYDLAEQPIHLESVTRKLVKESDDFLRARHEDGAPFLLLVSWLHVHTAVVSGPQFRGQSSHGPYGDAVQEMDWGVGQVMDMLDRYGMAQNTWVYFTSDHGGDPLEKDPQGRVTGGSNGIFKGRKFDGGAEGAIRVPGIVRWPGRIAAGRAIDEPVSLMDVLPTVSALLHVPSNVTSGHVLDGASLMPLLEEQEQVSPHEFLFHYCHHSIHAVRYRPRSGKTTWKLMLQEPNPEIEKVHTVNRCDSALHLDPPKLYDVTNDPPENLPVDLGQHAEILATMLRALEQHQQNVLPDAPSQFALHRMLWRPWLQPCCNFPLCHCEDPKFTGLFEN